MKKSNQILTVLFVFCLVLPILSVFATQQDSWTTMEPIPTANGWLGATMVNGKIYAIGGSGGYGSTTVNEYDPITNIWTTKTSMPTPRIFFGIAVVENKIYTIGGDRGNYEIGITPTAINEVYDPATDTWETKTSMPTRRFGVSASVVNNKIYIIGGKTSNPYPDISITEAYDPITDKWTTMEPLPTPVSHHTSAVVNNKIYILGGAINVNLNQIYDTEIDSWTDGNPLPTGVDQAAAAVINVDNTTQRIFVVGGKQDIDAVNLNQVYIVEEDRWFSGPSMPTARHGLGVAVVNDSIYAIGGREGSPFFGFSISLANERYTPIVNNSDYTNSEFILMLLLTVILTSIIIVIIAVIYKRNQINQNIQTTRYNQIGRLSKKTIIQKFSSLTIPVASLSIALVLSIIYRNRFQGKKNEDK